MFCVSVFCLLVLVKFDCLVDLRFFLFICLLFECICKNFWLFLFLVFLGELFWVILFIFFLLVVFCLFVVRILFWLFSWMFCLVVCFLDCVLRFWIFFFSFLVYKCELLGCLFIVFWLVGLLIWIDFLILVF